MPLSPPSPENLWLSLPQPFAGFSPMDGVTNAACRFITAKYGNPDISFTEFTSAEGLRAGAMKLLKDFRYTDIERPIIAQIFGADPTSFIQAAAIASALGFDGIDINMGCPAKNVTQHGAGASLIKDPERAKEIILNAKAGTRLWADGASLEDLNVHKAIIEKIGTLNADKTIVRKALPISVKTRIGYDAVVVEEWIAELLEAEPVAITIHGRTLKQLYSGAADWQAIARGVAIGRGCSTLFVGNGDIRSLAQGKKLCKEYGTHGFLIGRAAIGNPWIFAEKEPSLSERLHVAGEHARLHGLLEEPQGFQAFRKHLVDYTRDIPGAKYVRMNLMNMNTADDVVALLATLQV